MRSLGWAFHVLLALVVSGCASLPNVTTGQVDGRQVEYALSGQGNPVVVFENGLGGTMDWWAKVFRKLQKMPRLLSTTALGTAEVNRLPRHVTALVLVDSTHPNQMKGAGATENWPAWLRVAFDAASSAAAKDELGAIDLTGEEVLSLPTFVGKPVIVLSALQPMKEKSALADHANEKRQDIVRLHPGSRQIWVDAGHGIPLEKPEAVISAIRQVLSP